MLEKYLHIRLYITKRFLNEFVDCIVHTIVVRVHFYSSLKILTNDT